MTIAVATLAIALIAQPGLAFILGLYSPARYSRDAGRRNPLGELALGLTISAAIHLVFYWLVLLFERIFEIPVTDTIIASVGTLNDLNSYNLSLLPFNLQWLIIYLLVVTGMVVSRFFRTLGLAACPVRHSFCAV